MSSPIFHTPDFSCPFILQTDASDIGLGAVLSLVPSPKGPPCDLHQLAESKYAAVQKEALAIKWAVLELRYYLPGHRFTLITDHAPLQRMARAKDTNVRVTWWFQDFHFKVQHRAEASNVNADGLSRLRSG